MYLLSVIPFTFSPLTWLSCLFNLMSSLKNELCIHLKLLNYQIWINILKVQLKLISMELVFKKMQMVVKWFKQQRLFLDSLRLKYLYKFLHQSSVVIIPISNICHCFYCSSARRLAISECFPNFPFPVFFSISTKFWCPLLNIELYW